MASRARPAGVKSALSEYLVKMKTEGIAKAMSQVSKFGKSIEQLSKIHKSSVKSSKDFDWASQKIGETYSYLQSEALRVNYLFGLYEKELADVGEGVARASSLTADQIEVMDELADSIDRILKKKGKDKELSSTMIGLLEDQRQEIARTRLEVIKFQDAEEKLSIATKFMGEAWADSFGKLTSGSKDAEKVMGIIGRSASRIAPLMKPHLDKVKKQLTDTFMQKFDLGVDEGGIADALKKFTAQATKKEPEKFKGISSLVKKKEVTVSPGKSIGDVKKMADAVGKLQKSGTKAGAGMAKATKGMAGAAKAGTKVGIVTKGVGKAMAKTGAKTAAKAGAMTALKGAVGAIAPPLGLLLLLLDGVSMAMSFLSEGISLNIENMERFRHTGHRASGSMRDLLDTSSDLSISLGASSEEAYGTVQALTEAGFAVDSLGEALISTDGTLIKGQKALLRLSQANLRFADSTGASAKITAGFQKRLTAMKVPVEEQEAALGALSQASAKYMLTGAELDNMMQILTKTSIQIEAVWADTNMYDYTMALGALSGAAKAAGIDMGITAQIMDDVSKASKRALMIAQAGGGLGAFFGGDQTAALAATAKGADAVLKRIKGYTNAVAAARVAEVYGGVEYLTALSKSGKELEKQAAKRAAMSNEERARGDMLKTSREALDKGYTESTKTITKAFQRLSAPILMAAAKVAGPLVDAVAGMAAYVRPLMDEIGSSFNTLWQGIKDIFTPFMPAIRVIGKLIWGAIVFTVMRVTTTIKALGWALSVVGKILSFVFAPVNWGLEVIEALIDGVIYGMLTMGKWIDAAIDGFWKILKPLTAFIDKFASLGKMIMDFKEFMFGSSFLHIGEGIGEVLPSIDKLASGFDKTAKAALNAKKAAAGSSLLHLKEGVNEVLPSMDKLQESFKFPERPEDKAEETKQPMGAYTVKFRDDMSKDQVKSQSEANTSILEIHRLIREYMGRAADDPSKQVVDAIEKAERYRGAEGYGHQPVGRPRRPGGRRPGERLQK